MSQENVNVVRRLYEHWGRGDWNTGEFFDPAVKYARIGSDVPGDAGEWTGLREMWKAAVAYLDAWEELRNEAERFIDLGDRVLVLDRQTGRGRRSGVVLDHELAQVFTVRDEAIVCWQSYWHRSEALEAVGLRE